MNKRYNPHEIVAKSELADVLGIGVRTVEGYVAEKILRPIKEPYNKRKQLFYLDLNACYYYEHQFDIAAGEKFKPLPGFYSPYSKDDGTETRTGLRQIAADLEAYRIREETDGAYAQTIEVNYTGPELDPVELENYTN